MTLYLNFILRFRFCLLYMTYFIGYTTLIKTDCGRGTGTSPLICLKITLTKFGCRIPIVSEKSEIFRRLQDTIGEEPGIICF